MNRVEAKWLLLRSLAAYRKHDYDDLRALVGETQTVERIGSSGTEYALEFNFVWDAKPGGNIRVLASIDDGRWRAFLPLTYDFIVSPPPHTMSGRP
jgi:hypothetical protein